MLTKTATAQVSGKLEKKNYPPKTQADKVPATPAKTPLFSSAVSYGNSASFSQASERTSRELSRSITKHVLDELEKNLINAGSSMDKVLKVNVYLNDLKDYAAMNSVYATGKWGSVPPVRTTVAPAGGIPGDSLVEIDLIAYI